MCNTHNTIAIIENNDDHDSLCLLNTRNLNDRTWYIIGLFVIVASNCSFSYVICEYANLPNDCVPYSSINDAYDRITFMSLHILLLFYVNNAHHLKSYHICDFCNDNTTIKCLVNCTLSLGSNIMISYISSIDVLEGSITPQKNKQMEMTPYLISIYAVVVFIPCCFIVKNICQRTTKTIDVVKRTFITLWFAIWSVLLYQKSNNVHLHHTLFSFITCIWCYQDNILIQILFYISLGIFIQGTICYPNVGLVSSELKTRVKTDDAIENNSTINCPNVVYIYTCEMDVACEMCFNAV